MNLKKSILKNNQTVEISGSKSISNRLLILESLFNNLEIGNLSNSEDTRLLKKALLENPEIADIGNAGTAMRFLTSYFSIFEGKTTILTGSERMKERPIKPLVDALKNLGAEIQYIENEGFPPLKIIGKKLTKNSVKISANVSSQFITSLLLIGAKLENGLEIELIGEITSRPYLEMTLKILKEIGISCEFNGNLIKILPKTEKQKSSIIHYEIESDWSSASYFYSLSAIGRKIITLKNYKNVSLQGDALVKKIYAENFGINTISDDSEPMISLIPNDDFEFPKLIKLNMNDCPDIAQTVCVTASTLKIPFHIYGLSTLKIKETDRLIALQNELKKIGCRTEITEDSIMVLRFSEPEKNISIQTYGDHRMAMSFAPFCLIETLNIENEDVVKKSYPDFWRDFGSLMEKTV
ncbi:MAG: 3-phosphoshikimate 1-carboxyvinyltransferase [Flavobacteriaceae bacterium]|nr:3-phosphoshikimate 1-carboxyvinyltransferase [Flavobacteriaceae bacterium]